MHTVYRYQTLSIERDGQASAKSTKMPKAPSPVTPPVLRWDRFEKAPWVKVEFHTEFPRPTTLRKETKMGALASVLDRLFPVGTSRPRYDNQWSFPRLCI